DKDVGQWQVSEALWHAVLKAFRDESQLVKEKESQITASEIYAGVVRASHHFIAIRKSPFQKEADFLRFLDKEVQQVMLRAIRLCPSKSEYYSLFNSDNTNTEWVTKPVLELALLSLTNRSTEDLVAACLGKQTSTSEDSGKDKKEKGFVSPDKQVCASRYIGEMLICFAFRGIQQCKDILQVMLREVEENKEKDKNELQLQLDCFIVNPYKHVREDFSTLSHLVRSLRLKNENAMKLFDHLHSLSEFTYLIESVERRYVQYYQLQIKENEHTLKSESSDIAEKKTENETTSSEFSVQYRF
ncbi:hypothetical protein RFI_25853, partial [Reticulomyxa filosa]